VEGGEGFGGVVKGLVGAVGGRGYRVAEELANGIGGRGHGWLLIEPTTFTTEGAESTGQDPSNAA
jgi:hypothetical protein